LFCAVTCERNADVYDARYDEFTVKVKLDAILLYALVIGLLYFYVESSWFEYCTVY